MMNLARRVLRRVRQLLPDASAAPPQPVAPPPNPAHERYWRREGFIITDLVSAVMAEAERFTILDGGAREALSDPRWRAFPANRVRLFGFEPDAREVEELNRTAAAQGLDYRYYAAGLWSQPSKLTFYENKSPGGGSFYAQNTALTNRWKFENAKDKFYARDIFHPTGTSQWELTSIERWAQEHAIRDLDFMKLNVQGAELEILKGAGSLLDGVIGLMVEVSFVESYKERPFFADIDSFLRARNFTFFDLIGHHHMGRARSSITVLHAPGLYPLSGQLIEGHGIYFKDPIASDGDALPLAKLLKLACFAEIFGQNEYAFELLDWLPARQRRLGDASGAQVVAEVLQAAEARYRELMGGWAPLPAEMR